MIIFTWQGIASELLLMLAISLFFATQDAEPPYRQKVPHAVSVAKIDASKEVERVRMAIDSGRHELKLQNEWLKLKVRQLIANEKPFNGAMYLPLKD